MCITQDRLHTNCDDFTAKDKWPPNMSDLEPFTADLVKALHFAILL